MPPELRKQIRSIILVGLGALVLVNGCSWQPGYGGRNDRKPGMEVERYFGWPACFYADLWRSDHDHEIALPLYFPPMPLSREMYFVYFSGSVLAFLLNVSFAACVVGVCLILVWSEQRRAKAWMKYLGVGLSVIAVLAVLFGDKFSAYL